MCGRPRLLGRQMLLLFCLQLCDRCSRSQHLGRCRSAGLYGAVACCPHYALLAAYAYPDFAPVQPDGVRVKRYRRIAAWRQGHIDAESLAAGITVNAGATGAYQVLLTACCDDGDVWTWQAQMKT
jgi:hypothetical protein